MVKLFFLILAATSTAALAHDLPSTLTDAQVPAAFLGTWGKNGRCDIAADRLRMTPRRAGLGLSSPKPVIYSQDDKTVRWGGEYDVAFFEIGGWPDTLVYNREGGNMPDARDLYVRCKQGMKRMPRPR